MNDLELLLAERDIRNVVLRYCHGVDRGDADLIRGCYHPGSVDVHGRYDGDGPSFADHAVKVLGERYRSTSHTVPNIRIEFESSTSAHVASSFVAYHLADSPVSEAHLYVFAGRYVDRFEKRDNEWRISHRVVVRDWSVRHPIPEDSLAREVEEGLLFEPGRRSREDIGYPDAFSAWVQSRSTSPDSNAAPVAIQGESR